MRYLGEDFEDASQPERNECIGDVTFGLHGVDGLQADANLARESGGRVATFLTNVTQAIFNIHAASLELWLLP